MTGWNVPIKSTLVAIVAAILVASTFATANATPDPAKRYRAEQITEGDVILQEPEIQVILQNDDFQRMLREEDLDEVLERLDDFLPWNFDALRGSRKPGGLDRVIWPPFVSLNVAHRPPAVSILGRVQYPTATSILGRVQYPTATSILGRVQYPTATSILGRVQYPTASSILGRYVPPFGPVASVRSPLPS